MISLLNSLDLSRFSIDLQMFKHGGAFEKYLPYGINILPLLPFNRFLQTPPASQFLCGKAKFLLSRIKYTLYLHTHTRLLNREIARQYWRCCGDCYDVCPTEYDVAIAYGQGVPTFYVAHKVRAKKKLAWVNAEYVLKGRDRQFQYNIYGKIDRIVAVSDTVLRQFQTVYPEYGHKMAVMPDLIDADLIVKMSRENVPGLDLHTKKMLVTVARLDGNQKGYDILLETCLQLRKQTNDFEWLIIGEGPFRAEMEKFIADNNLHDCLFLLGAKPNPYPYMAAATVYVQTSRNEGFGLSIAEALILNKPVVSTEFSCVHDQIKHGLNGLICQLNPKEIAEKINGLLHDPDMRRGMAQYSQRQVKGNARRVSEFYNLLNE